MLKYCLVLLALITQDCWSQEEDGPYRGKFIGKLNSYHHQVSGEVWAADERTLLLVNFNYDGTGDDTYFWVGDAPRAGPHGFILPDEHGKTNVLERYYNAEVRLTLPEGKKVSRLKWVSIYDVDSQNVFGDVYVPDEFEAPAPRDLPALASASSSNGAVRSRPLRVLSASTLLIPEFRYDGSGEEVYFWAGVGPQPSDKGFKIPDEYGYLEPLRPYNGVDVRLQLPGASTVFDVNWVSVYDVAQRRALATVLLPVALNVPPAPRRAHPYTTSLPACVQLHRDLQVSWEVFGPQVTFELAGQIGRDEYMAFGISGDDSTPAMVGADVAVLRFDEKFQRGLATDYNITAKSEVLGAWAGVCRDDVLGGQDSNQVFLARREDGLTVISYRRTLQPTEPMDREWSTSGPVSAIWAVGSLHADGEPAFHRLYPRRPLLLRLGDQPPRQDCFQFTIEPEGVAHETEGTTWERAQLFDPALRVFRFALGPSGPGGAAALAWYVNGQLAPDLQIRRGLTYTFEVAGGNDPHSPTEYHPLIVSAERDGGGLERLVEGAQAAAAARVLAGIHATRRGRLAPTAAGPLCVARHGADADRRRDADYRSFRSYNRSLHWSCSGTPARLVITPNTSWPDIVYYHSFTHRGMGGRIFVVDRHKRNLGRKSSAATRPLLSTLLPALSALFVLLPALIAGWRH